MFNIRGNYVRQTAEHRGTRHAECRTKSLTRTHTHNQISGNLVMKDENNLMTLRFDDNKFDIKRNQIAKFLKTFSEEKKSNQTFNMASGWLPPFGSSSGASRLWPIKT